MPTVLTVGTIHGGTKNNIIPDEVTMGLTLRTYSLPERDEIIADIRRTANGLAEAYGIPADRMPTVTVAETTPVTYNDPALAERIRKAAVATLGADRVNEATAVMGSEDVGLFTLDGKIPGSDVLARCSRARKARPKPENRRPVAQPAFSFIRARLCSGHHHRRNGNDRRCHEPVAIALPLICPRRYFFGSTSAWYTTDRLINFKIRASASHPLDHAHKHDVVSRVDPEPRSRRAIPEECALAIRQIRFWWVEHHRAVVSIAEARPHRICKPMPNSPVSSFSGKWFDVIRCTVDGARMRVPFSAPPPASICAKR